MRVTVDAAARQASGPDWWRIVGIIGRASPLVFTAVVIATFIFAAYPVIEPGVVPGFTPDSPDYAYGAAALLRGEYMVEWPGVGGERHIPRYSPGYPIMLIPAVLLGGVEAAVWVPYLMAVALLCLAAGLAYRLAGPYAALLCVAFLAFTHAIPEHALIVMSDLPSTTLLLAELWIIVLARNWRWWVAAGILAGVLISVRPANAVLLLAGLAAATVVRKGLAFGAAYLAGAIPFGLLLGVWQWRMFGSPLRTGYQAIGAGAEGGHALETFFSPHFITSPPWGGSNLLSVGTPNLRAYLGALLGEQMYLSPPGVGLIGVITLIIFARHSGADGLVGRFGGAVVLLLTALYLPYFWQDPRFLMAPAVFLSLAASIALPRLVNRVMRAGLPVFSSAHSRSTGDIAPLR